MEKENKFCANITTDAIEEQKKNSEQEEKKQAKKGFVFDSSKYFDTQLEQGTDQRKVKIRILPLSVDNPNLYETVMVHSLKVSKHVSPSGFKTFTCLNDKHAPNYNPNVKCPLCAKAKELYDQADVLKSEGRLQEADTIRKEASTYLKKETYILRLIDRSKEEEGPKFWRIKKKQAEKDIRTKLIELYNDRRAEYKEANGEDYNIFDLENGRDLILTLKREQAKNAMQRDSVSITINDESLPKPLSKDVEQANNWIKDTTKWQDLYAVRGADYLSVIAEKLIPWKDKETGNYKGMTDAEYIKATTPNDVDVTLDKEADDILMSGSGLDQTPTSEDNNVELRKERARKPIPLGMG